MKKGGVSVYEEGGKREREKERERKRRVLQRGGHKLAILRHAHRQRQSKERQQNPPHPHPPLSTNTHWC